MAVKTRSDFFGLQTTINTRRLSPTSRLVAHVTGIAALLWIVVYAHLAFRRVYGQSHFVTLLKEIGIALEIRWEAILSVGQAGKPDLRYQMAAALCRGLFFQPLVARANLDEFVSRGGCVSVW